MLGLLILFVCALAHFHAGHIVVHIHAGHAVVHSRHILILAGIIGGLLLWTLPRREPGGSPRKRESEQYDNCKRNELLSVHGLILNSFLFYAPRPRKYQVVADRFHARKNGIRRVRLTTFDDAQATREDRQISGSGRICICFSASAASKRAADPTRNPAGERPVLRRVS
jgi:hypothetical protein